MADQYFGSAPWRWNEACQRSVVDRRWPQPDAKTPHPWHWGL